MDFKQKLIKEYRFRFELHAHSKPVSPCSNFEYKELAQIFIEDKIDGMVLTNHMTPEILKKYPDVKDAAEYYIKDYHNLKCFVGDKLSVCLGVELRFAENNNDYLIYGVDEEDIEKFISYTNKGIDEFYREMKNEKNLIIQAHPFRDGIEQVNPASIDGIEVFNFHIGHNSRIAKAAQYAKDNKMLVSGGLDLHHLYQRNQFVMRCKEVPKDSYDVAELVKSGDFIFEIGDSIIIP